MTVAKNIINRLGGTRAAARLLDKPPSTVQTWKASGLIPARYQAEILEKAKVAGISIQALDLIPHGRDCKEPYP